MDNHFLQQDNTESETSRKISDVSDSFFVTILSRFLVIINNTFYSVFCPISCDIIKGQEKVLQKSKGERHEEK